MAYTILATWDFRTATAATGRASRVGSYTLTEAGTPSWSVNGVDCSASAANRLTLTLPVELRVSPVWWIAGMRLIDGTAPSGYTTLVGLTKSNLGEFERALLLWRNASGTNLGVAHSSVTDDVSTGVTLATGADITIAARRTGVNNPAFSVKVNADAWDGGVNTPNAVDLTATSQLVFGSLGANSSFMRYHWLIMGSGAITDGEVDAMLANPNAFIYPSVGPDAATLLAYRKNILRMVD